ncbi:hypothetical protein L6Q85_07070 [bacterium]|nr:hypothetical protein [bacterium]NUP91320.1 hypothetical protein [Candidatus Omnitrophota bacterium]
MKKVSISLVIALAALVLGIYGCGNSSEPQPPKKPAQKTTAKKPAATPATAKKVETPAVAAKEPAAAKATPATEKADTKPVQPPAPPSSGEKTSEVDFASLKEFPDLKYSASENTPGNGDVRMPLMDGVRLKDEEGELIERYWQSKAPAYYEINLPTGSKITRIEVEDYGTEFAFPVVHLFAKTDLSFDWKAITPAKTEKKEVEFWPGKTVNRWIFHLDPTSASAVKFDFPEGCVRNKYVYVMDIDIFGYIDKP